MNFFVVKLNEMYICFLGHVEKQNILVKSTLGIVWATFVTILAILFQYLDTLLATLFVKITNQLNCHSRIAESEMKRIDGKKEREK